MPLFNADLHIHTVLSPCADLEMTPLNIVEKAKQCNIQIIGITDHNSTRNAKLVRELGKKEGILVLTGAEVTTKEEVHCLAFFEDDMQLDAFQHFLDKRIQKIPNPDGHFGYQPVVDEKEDIVEMVPYYLAAALDAGISEIQRKVVGLEGIFIPAHVDRSANGIFSQLGFIPPELNFDALGISPNGSIKDVRKHYNVKNEISLFYNSDAHFLSQIGTVFSTLSMEHCSFGEVKMALNQLNGRRVETE